MKLSTKGRYGIRAMYELAYVYGQGPLSIKEIAARQAIPEAYLEQLVLPLKRAGLVTATRGALGGYTLTKAPEDTSVGEVLHALEGPMAPASCVLEDDPCENADGCAMHKLYKRIHEGLNEILNSITLAEMLEDKPCHCS